MSKYVLVSMVAHTYNDGRNVWRLWGWQRGADNAFIGEYENKLTAFEIAHALGAPVVLGYGDWLYAIAEALYVLALGE